VLVFVVCEILLCCSVMYVPYVWFGLVCSVMYVPYVWFGLFIHSVTHVTLDMSITVYILQHNL
jgi:hypothetical protein